MFKAFITWLRSVYSEADGSGSSTRVHISCIVAFVIGVGVSFCVSLHHKVITMAEFNSFLDSSATFLTTVCGVLYGINKAGSYMDGKNDQKPN